MGGQARWAGAGSHAGPPVPRLRSGNPHSFRVPPESAPGCRLVGLAAPWMRPRPPDLPWPVESTKGPRRAGPRYARDRVGRRPGGEGSGCDRDEGPGSPRVGRPPGAWYPGAPSPRCRRCSGGCAAAMTCALLYVEPDMIRPVSEHGAHAAGCGPPETAGRGLLYQRRCALDVGLVPGEGQRTIERRPLGHELCGARATGCASSAARTGVSLIGNP